VEADCHRCQKVWADCSALAESPSRELKRPSAGYWVPIRSIRQLRPEIAEEDLRRRPRATFRHRQLRRRRSWPRRMSHPLPLHNCNSSNYNDPLKLNSISSSNNRWQAFSNTHPSSLTLDPILVQVHSDQSSLQVLGPSRLDESEIEACRALGIGAISTRLDFLYNLQMRPLR